MSIITNGEAGGSLSSGNNKTCSGREYSDHHDDQEMVVQKQEGFSLQDHHQINFHGSINNSLSSTTTLSNGSTTQPLQPHNKKKRNPPGNPDPTAKVIALSPNSLLAKNRFVCEICSKGFQRDQNLQLHRRGHNLPWKLRQRNPNEVVRKQVYICPEVSCVHHNPARALGDLTGIKKHFSRKHGEKKWKCERCSKKYAVQSDWKAHSKTCGTREYKCECGTIFSRRDSFITHRAFCDAIAEENSKTTLLGPERQPNHDQISNRSTELISSLINNTPTTISPTNDNINGIINDNNFANSTPPDHQALNTITSSAINPSRLINSDIKTPQTLDHQYQNVSAAATGGHHYMSATALLQKAAQMGSTVAGGDTSVMAPPSYHHHHHQSHHDHHHHQYQQGLINMNSNANGNNNSTNPNNMGFFGGLLFGAHQNHAGNANNDVGLHGSVRGSSGTNNGGDVMTVDFLGINGRSDHLGKFVDQKHQAVNNNLSNSISSNNGIISDSNKQLLGDNDNQVLRFNGVINTLQGLSQFEQHVWEV